MPVLTLISTSIGESQMFKTNYDMSEKTNEQILRTKPNVEQNPRYKYRNPEPTPPPCLGNGKKLKNGQIKLND